MLPKKKSRQSTIIDQEPMARENLGPKREHNILMLINSHCIKQPPNNESLILIKEPSLCSKWWLIGKPQTGTGINIRKHEMFSPK